MTQRYKQQQLDNLPNILDIPYSKTPKIDENGNIIDEEIEEEFIPVMICPGYGFNQFGYQGKKPKVLQTTSKGLSKILWN